MRRFRKRVTRERWFHLRAMFWITLLLILFWTLVGWSIWRALK